MSSLFTAILGGNLSANNQASSTATLLNQNANATLQQIAGDNQTLSGQETAYSQLYAQAYQGAASLLGVPLQNAGKLTGLKKINPTGPAGAMATTASSSLKGN